VRVSARVPAYFDVLIDGFQRGVLGRCVHLGHWDDTPAPGRDAPSWAEFTRAQERLDDVLIEVADLHDGQSVLDVGCGFGGTLKKVDESHRSLRLMGVNIDSRQLEICRQLDPGAGNTFEWVQADACHLPAADESFDRILCIEAMFHFASRRAFFLEAARVLRPGGVVVLSDMFLAPSAREVDLPGFGVDAILRDGYGPWPDVWCEGGTHVELGRAAALDRTWYMDATRQTLPSHRFTVPRDVDERRDPGDAGLRAAMMLRWLHARGHLTYAYMRFDKGAGHTVPSRRSERRWP